MAHGNPGYDIESKRGRVLDRYIEVKGIDGEWGQNGVPLSDVQFEFAMKNREKFWLYVVENALNPEKVVIHTIRNPASTTAQFRFDHGWKHRSENTEGFEALLPQKGMLISVFDEDQTVRKGEITIVSLNDETFWLNVIFNGPPSETVIYNPTSMVLEMPPSDSN